MAIHIIGASNTEEDEADVLPKFDADLPHPNGATENHRVLTADQIVALLAHENPVVRTYALEQVMTRTDEPELVQATVAVVDDEDPLVAIEAIGVLERAENKSAVDRMKARFADAQGDLAAALASALGQLAPDVLLSAVQARGRLDGEAYAATATALAIIGSDEVISFLDKALNRAGALSAERKGALYGSALLSGDPKLSSRVLSYAIDDSKKEEPENASFPTRAALAVLTGAPIPYSRKEAGLELLDLARETIEAEVLPLLPESDREPLEASLKLKRPGEILAALRPVLDIQTPEATTDEQRRELGTMPRRRRGLLTALIDKADAIGELDVQAAGIFVATATKAASIVIAGGGNEAKSPAIVALAKALEGRHDEEKLASMSVDELATMFQEKSPREMRRFLAVMTRETFLRGSTTERFFTAIIRGEHGEALLDAAAESEDPSIHAATVRAFGQARAEGENALVEVLSRTPLDERATPIALACAEELRTERIGLLVGRRFLELRPFGRGAVSRVLLRVGDPRLLPVLESRAFPDEAEEVAWAVLALITGAPVEGKLKEALDRTMQGRDPDPTAPEVRLPLSCERCKETLWYGYERVYLDVDAKDEIGDPAFVGSTACKACGADGRLKPTPEGAQILTQHMMQFLQAAQSGRLDAPPLVTPAQTDVNGKKLGLSAALRALAMDIEASPAAIRPRLHRARLRLLLKRPGVVDDLDAVLETDPTCVEAMAMKATTRMRDSDHEGAAKFAVQALTALRVDEDARLYDTENRQALIENLEEYLVEIEMLGTPIDAAVDLTAARRRRDEKVREAQHEYEARQNAARGGPQGPPPAAANEPPPDAFKNARRNDPCPCGSGKKFKKCHGAR